MRARQFQRAIRECLGPQLGRNVKAYMVDIVIKSKRGESLIDDLRETFYNVRKVKLKLNPKKCTFGVYSGQLLGFLVSHRGIQANLKKIEAIERMEAPRKVRDVQRKSNYARVRTRIQHGLKRLEAGRKPATSLRTLIWISWLNIESNVVLHEEAAHLLCWNL